ncbi:hypothetical protein KP79_PYT23140 [Mizuhopecten yessoensis]|uniref:Uncharacterized protein n=1 Tax=Mizuhopecten yessoensis TaxID=6573 RepID=A0A210Q464_MIZYE|nr:hypothetical protein KP79_PYT23140 [Mizuhopecten yessoensis]
MKDASQERSAVAEVVYNLIRALTLDVRSVRCTENVCTVIIARADLSVAQSADVAPTTGKRAL